MGPATAIGAIGMGQGPGSILDEIGRNHEPLRIPFDHGLFGHGDHEALHAFGGHGIFFNFDNVARAEILDRDHPAHGLAAIAHRAQPDEVDMVIFPLIQIGQSLPAHRQNRAAHTLGLAAIARLGQARHRAAFIIGPDFLESDGSPRPLFGAQSDQGFVFGEGIDALSKQFQAHFPVNAMRAGNGGQFDRGVVHDGSAARGIEAP